MDGTKMDSKTRHIAIVGGGSAGWMSAAFLSRHLPANECRISVIDCEDGGVGVGEATIPSVNRLLRTLNADESEFMQACDATWKLGIQFSDWLQPGHDIWHPFGVCGAQIDGNDLFPFWLTNVARNPSAARPYHSYSLHWAASLAGKSPHANASTSPIAATGSYAFHLDSSKFAAWLKVRAVAAEVRHIRDRVALCRRSADGDVESLTMESGDVVQADFFIDCTGFESVLADSSSQNWSDWSRQLLCDRAVTITLPPAAIVPSHTKATALSAGWCWDIPVTTRRGVGYVFSSQFVSDEDAISELKAHCQLNADDKIDHRVIPMTVGRRKQIWENNVLSVGLSAGFTEPLESSGLHLIQVGLEELLQHFPTQKAFALQKDAYNQRMSYTFDQVRDFIQLHYHLNQRPQESDPHGFWTAAREAPISPELQHRLKLYSENGTLPPLDRNAFGDTSYYFLLTGSKQLPRRPSAGALAADAERVAFVLRAILDQNRGALRELPLHEEALKKIHRPVVAKAS